MSEGTTLACAIGRHGRCMVSYCECWCHRAVPLPVEISQLRRIGMQSPEQQIPAD